MPQRIFVTAGLSIWLAGCGGGPGSPSSNLLGGSQQPDPVTLDFPLAYVKRPLRIDAQATLPTTDVRDPSATRPGAELFLRDRASPSALERSLTGDLFPPDADGNPAVYDIKHLSASYDGGQLLFALRAPLDPDLDDDEQPTWNIWRYDHSSASIARVIESDIGAEEGHDLSPRFLPDGRILFASTRQRQGKAILLDEGKPQFAALDEDRDQPALTLHVMEDDGSDLHQISFNASSDFDPAVLSDGRVVYSRWDNIANINRISLYTMLPDGRQQELLYGIESHDSLSAEFDIEFVRAQELPDGRLLAQLVPADPSEQLGTLPVAIDIANYIDNTQPTVAASGLVAPAQELLIPGALTLTDDPSPAGRYASIAPMFDGSDRLLVTWSQCRLLDPARPAGEQIVPCTEDNLNAGFAEADPLFGVWVHDLLEDTQQPIVLPAEGEAYTEAVVLESRQIPQSFADAVPGIDVDATLVDEGVGVLHIRSVYDIDGTGQNVIETLRDPAQATAAERPARFLRLVKSVPMADDDIVDIDNTAFGRSRAQLMREILGYTTIEPDGSAQVQVPANVPFYISVLDAAGQRIGGRHQNWLQLRPGEQRECAGCHDRTSDLPHGRADAQAPSANPGAPTDGSPFPNSQATLFANAGETMAEVRGRIEGIRALDVDINFTDVWTDPGVREPDPDIALSYTDLPPPWPVADRCVTQWSATCRTIINYETHLHPLWSTPRIEFDTDNITEIANNTCNTCHSTLDAAGVLQIPIAQLNLADGISPDQADHFNSYRELLFTDGEQELANGALVDLLLPLLDGDGNPVFEVDANGELVLDGNGDPIPVLFGPTVAPPMSVAGAAASVGFFAPFATGASHAGWLTPIELKLIAEWLDVGAQYYNNPFDVPP